MTLCFSVYGKDGGRGVDAFIRKGGEYAKNLELRKKETIERESCKVYIQRNFLDLF